MHSSTTGVVERPPVRVDQKQASIAWVANRAHELLDAHCVAALRISLGLVFLVFGTLKFVGMSPAAALAARTIHALTFGLISGEGAVLLTAAMETFIGLTLLSGRLLRVGLVMLGMAMVGILSPLVLFTNELVASGGPTLAGQYVFKDIVLVCAGLVVAADTLGARLTRP